MVTVTISLAVGYIYKELKKRKIMNTAVKEKEIMMENYKLHFNEKWRRACNINKIKRKKRVKKLLNKLKCNHPRNSVG